MRESVIGKSVTRLDVRTKVTGGRKYPQDFYMEGMLHAKVVWSADPHARLVAIDTSAAEAYPGVMAVLTHVDVPVNEFGINIPDQPVLAEAKVRSVGDPVALVIAESEGAAEAARELVRVEYESLPVVIDPREAMKPDSPLVHEEKGSNILRHIKIRKGDVEEGFARSDVIVEGAYHTPRIEHAFMQPEAGLGYIDDRGRVTVIVAAQWAHDDIHQIAHALNLPEDQVHEIIPSIGGAFGGREDISLQILVALGAYRTRRPVKLVYTREESIRGHGKRHPFFMKYKTGATRDGKLMAIETEVITDAGAYASTSTVVLSNAASFGAGPYVYPHAKIDAYTVYTNNLLSMAMRGFGAAQTPVGYELQMDKMAAALGMDPVEFRLRNLVEDGSVAVTGNVMGHGVGIKQTLMEAGRAAGWKEVDGNWVKPELDPPSSPYKRRGIGVACAYKNVGYSFGFDDKSKAIVELTLDESGQVARVLVKIGASEVGQGVLTALAQIAAETLGIDVKRVRIARVDTAEVPDGGSTSASRHVYVSGNAVMRAARLAKERWEAVLRAETGETHIEAESLYHARDGRATTPYDPETGMCEPHISYSYGTQIALVEVDIETGVVEVLKMYAANDVGKVINPAMAFGQVAGGIQMGLGFALTEEFIQEGGYIKTRKFSEYHTPTVIDMPEELVCINVEVPDPTGPFGATGLGETPTLPTAPAILNAIHDATGVWLDRIPTTPERVLRAIRGKLGLH